MPDPAALYFVCRFLSWYCWEQAGREIDEVGEDRATRYLTADDTGADHG